MRSLQFFALSLTALAGLAVAVVALASATGWDLASVAIAASGFAAALSVAALTFFFQGRSERGNVERAVENAEARIGGIVDSAMDAIITIDESQRIVLFNAAAEAVFCCARDEAIGSPLSWFIPPRFREAHAAHVEGFGAGDAGSRRMGSARVVAGVRRNGEEFPIEASISQTVEGGQRFYTVILRDVTARVRAEEALRESREEIQTLALAANDAREQEKRRIARELHDELGQSLTALKMDVVSLREGLPGVDETLTRKLDSMQQLLDATVAAARRISSDLRPMMLDDLGLTAAADWLVQNFTKRNGIRCELVLSADSNLDLPDPYGTAIFRVLQESLTNVAKHAEATQVEVTLEKVGDEAILSVRDNGKGMMPDSMKKQGSFGLTGLRERAYLLRGSLRVDSAPGKGTLIEFRVPVPPAKEAGA